MPKGLYVSGHGWARVKYDDGQELDIHRPQYEAQGYAPPFDRLPTQAEYEARLQSQKILKQD